MRHYLNDLKEKKVTEEDSIIIKYLFQIRFIFIFRINFFLVVGLLEIHEAGLIHRDIKAEKFHLLLLLLY
jgi:serine/threonine protein kinase